MSEFYKILKSRNLNLHTGQPIWKYNISDFEFEQLKQKFKIVHRASELDPRSCAVYFAEWWKRNYCGGYPSIEHIYNSIGSDKLCFDVEEFYDLAKKGGNILNYKWIKIQNTLYLKTLLLQGGLPLNHIKNNKGKYRDFLLQIIHFNPNRIEDFSNYPDLINLLPKSSQNDIIYSSCLDIVRAVLDNDEKELLILNENEDIKQITEELILERNKVRKKNNPFKFKWSFNKESNNFYLNTLVKSKIQKEDIQYLLNSNVENFENEYKLFVGSDLIAKFIKRNDDNYKLVQFKEIVILNCEFEPEIYCIDNSDRFYEANHLLHSKLNFDIPCLWISTDENVFTLEKSRYTNNEFGYVFSTTSFKATNHFIEEEIVNNNSIIFKITKFQNEIVLRNSKEENYRFKTGTESLFDWTIISKMPKWLIKSNLTTVTNDLRILVYDKEGQKISNPKIYWKPLNSCDWNSIHVPMERGVLDVKISYHDVEEFERVFNLGQLDIKTNSNQTNSQLIIKNNPFVLEIYKSEIFNFDVNDNIIDFNLLDNSKLPKSIKVRIKCKNQNFGLISEILSPFQGVKIIDNNDNIVVDEVIYLDKIKGWRLVANNSEKEFEIKFSNNKNPEIIISKVLEKNIKSLLDFKDTFKSLFQLFNIIDKDNFLKMEICELRPNQTSRVIKNFFIKQFSETLNWSVNEDNIIKFNNDLSEEIITSIYALPLDCELEFIDKIELIKEEDFYSINSTFASKFILFSDKNAKNKIKPEFISIDPQNELTSIEDRNQRIQSYSKELLENDFESDIWNKFGTYYYTCRENDLPFATFDIIKAITISSELAAKAFVYLSLNFDENSNRFSGSDFQDLENDLGFSFHWIKLSDWENVCQIYPDIFKAIAIMLSLNWSDFKVTLLQNGKKSNYAFYAELNNVRQRLGERVLNQLPSYDITKDRNKYIKSIPDKQWNDEVNILVIAPLTVASSVSNINTGLWHINGDNFRRKIKYVENLDKKWYEESLIYFLN